jgi:hypothetical protein
MKKYNRIKKLSQTRLKICTIKLINRVKLLKNNLMIYNRN